MAVSMKPDPGSRTSSAVEANQFGSRGKPVREPVWELVLFYYILLSLSRIDEFTDSDID